MDQKAQIFLTRTLKRVDDGEFDEHLTIPFASRKLMKSLIEAEMQKKIETNATPVFSDTELYQIVGEVRETAAETASLFAKIGILSDEGDGHGVSPTWSKIINPQKLI